MINTCYDQNGNWRQNIGRAQPTPTGLTVNFNYALDPSDGREISSSSGDYRVLWTDYQTFSFVGGGPFYWILSRKPVITQRELSVLSAKTVELGYNPQRLIWNEPNLE